MQIQTFEHFILCHDFAHIGEREEKCGRGRSDWMNIQYIVASINSKLLILHKTESSTYCVWQFCTRWHHWSVCSYRLYCCNFYRSCFIHFITLVTQFFRRWRSISLEAVLLSPVFCHLKVQAEIVQEDQVPGTCRMSDWEYPEEYYNQDRVKNEILQFGINQSPEMASKTIPLSADEFEQILLTIFASTRVNTMLINFRSSRLIIWRIFQHSAK